MELEHVNSYRMVQGRIVHEQSSRFVYNCPDYIHRLVTTIKEGETEDWGNVPNFKEIWNGKRMVFMIMRFGDRMIHFAGDIEEFLEYDNFYQDNPEKWGDGQYISPFVDPGKWNIYRFIKEDDYRDILEWDKLTRCFRLKCFSETYYAIKWGI